MAPRTPEQQAAYNEKRRLANANAKKVADKYIPADKPAVFNAKNTSTEVKVARIKAAEKVHKAKVAAKPKSLLSAKQKKFIDSHSKVKPETTRGAGQERLAGKLKPHAQPMKNKFVSEPKNPDHVANGKAGAAVRKATVKGKKIDPRLGRVKIGEARTAPIEHRKPPKADIVKQVKTLGADSLLPDDPKAGLLMAKSHRREFKGNGATQRGTGWQVTVMFTADQLAVLKERAGLYNVSLSEAVRRCVMAGPLPE